MHSEVEIPARKERKMITRRDLDSVKVEVRLLRSEVARLTQHIADRYIESMDSYDVREKIHFVRDDLTMIMDYLGLEIQDLPAARKVVKKEK